MNVNEKVSHLVTRSGFALRGLQPEGFAVHVEHMGAEGTQINQYDYHGRVFKSSVHFEKS